MGNCTNQQRNNEKTQRKRSKSHLNNCKEFKFLEMIGTGGFSDVWKVENKKNGKIYALKVMEKARIIAKKSVDAVLLEKTLMSQLLQSRAQYIANMKSSFQDQSKLYLLMDYYQGHTLRFYIQQGISFSQNDIKKIVSGLLKALWQLYNKGIIHGDIKPQNILFSIEGVPHLSDFGSASYFQEQNSDRNSGTIGYMAPEVMNCQNHTFTADYYAIGVITYELFFGKRPFRYTELQQLQREIFKNSIDIEKKVQLSTISPQAADFIIKLLKRKPFERLGCKDGISELIDHPWIKQSYLELSLQEADKNFRIQQIVNHNHSSEDQHKEQTHQTPDDEKRIQRLLSREHIQKLFNQFNFQPENQQGNIRMELNNQHNSPQQTNKRRKTN